MFLSAIAALPSGIATLVGGHLSALAGEPTAIHAADLVQKWDLRGPEMPHVLTSIGDSIAERHESLAGDFQRIIKKIIEGHYPETHLSFAAENLASHLDEIDALWPEVSKALKRRAARFAEVSRSVVGIAENIEATFTPSFAGSTSIIPPEAGAVVMGCLEMGGEPVASIMAGAGLLVSSEELAADIGLALIQQWELLHKNVLDVSCAPISFIDCEGLRFQLSFLNTALFAERDQVAMVAAFQSDPWFSYLLQRAKAVTWERVRDVMSDALQAQLLLQELKARDPYRAADIERRFDPISPKEFSGILERQSGRGVPVESERVSATL